VYLLQFTNIEIEVQFEIFKCQGMAIFSSTE